MEVLTLSDMGGQFLMKNKLMSSLAKMISDEVEFVQSKQKDDPDRALSPEKMVRTMVKVRRKLNHESAFALIFVSF